MAWIESHQSLARHPKTRRLARDFGCSIATAIGYLHLVWYFALDYAQDGDLARFCDADIAEAVGLDGDPTRFVQALTDAGFLDPDRRIHDWQDYAGRLVQRRQADADRKRADRARSKNGRDPDHPPDVGRTSADTSNEGAGRRGDGVRTVPNRTQPNRTNSTYTTVPTEPNQPRADARDRRNLTDRKGPTNGRTGRQPVADHRQSGRKIRTEIDMDQYRAAWQRDAPLSTLPRSRLDADG